MNSTPEPHEHGRGDDAREEWVFRLYRALVGRHMDLQLREERDRSAQTARAARVEWRLIRRRLEDQVVGDGELLDRLATLALRLLLVGAPGAGKSHIAGVLADVIGGPVVTLDSTSITEAGWSGTSLADALGSAGAPVQLLGATVILEEADKLRVHREAHGNAIDKYRGQQAQYLSLLDRAGRVSVGMGSVASADMHVIITGAFADARWSHAGSPRELSREMLIGYGLLPELVDRIDHVILLTEPSVQALAVILARAVEGSPPSALREAVAAFGYVLRIEQSTYGFVAQALSGRSSTGTRAGHRGCGAARVGPRDCRESADG
jgi:hypothetical protein